MVRRHFDVGRMQSVIGILLWIHHPDDEVRKRHNPVHGVSVRRVDRIVIGEVDEDNAVKARVGVEPEPMGRRDAQPVKESVGVAPGNGDRIRGGGARDSN